MAAFFVILSCAFSALPGEAHFLAGQDAQSSGRMQEALAAYEACVEKDAALAPYALIHMGQCKQALGDKAGAEAAFRQVTKKMGTGPWQQMAHFHRARLLRETDRKKEAVPHYKVALNRPIQPWWMTPLAWEAAENQLAGGHEKAGLAWFRDTTENTVYYRKRLDAAAILTKTEQPELWLTALRGYIYSSAYPEAARVIKKGPAGLPALEGQYAALKTQDKRLAFVKGLFRENPGDDWLRLWLVYTMRRAAAQRRYEEAGALCDLVLIHGGKTREAPDALWWLARYLNRQEQVEGAQARFIQLAEGYPEDRRADDALFALGQSLEAKGDWAGAEKWYRELGKKHPASTLRSRAYYQAAQIRAAQGDAPGERLHLTSAAHKGLGFFHGHRALTRLYDALELPQENLPKLAIGGYGAKLHPYTGFQLAEQATAPMEDARVQRLFFFGKHGFEAGQWEALGWLEAAANPDESLRPYQIAASAGYSHTALKVALSRPSKEKAWKQLARMRSLEYPRPYWPLVTALAKQHKLDPYLILSVARQESTFRAGIRSHAGATGVMQLMPTTAKWLAKVDDRVPRDAAKRLESPQNSLRMGAVYLRRMLDRSDGNLVHAIASYNAGPGNCDKWRKRLPNASFDEFIAAISFDETKDYVYKVLANYAAYHSLYGEGA
jgi:soluble lytic murein transglycosylase-like protein